MIVDENELKTKRGRKARIENGVVQEFHTETVPTCSLLGLKEDECEVLFSVGNVFISDKALTIMTEQLATIRREKRGA